MLPNGDKDDWTWTSFHSTNNQFSKHYHTFLSNAIQSPDCCSFGIVCRAQKQIKTTRQTTTSHHPLPPLHNQSITIHDDTWLGWVAANIIIRLSLTHTFSPFSKALMFIFTHIKIVRECVFGVYNRFQLIEFLACVYRFYKEKYHSFILGTHSNLQTHSLFIMENECATSRDMVVYKIMVQSIRIPVGDKLPKFY